MDAENCLEYLFLLSGSPTDTTFNPTSLPPQGIPAFDEGCSDPCSLDIPDPQVDAEAYSTGFRSLLPTCPLETDSMCQTTTSSCMSNIFAESDTNCNRGQGDMTLLDNYSQPTAVQYQEGTSTEILQMSRNLGNGPTAASSRSSQKPSKKYIFRCSPCRRNYSQKQGLTRHFRDVHEDSFCPHCKGSSFTWHRPPELKKHLKEQHPDIDHRATLTKVTRHRRAATIKNSQKGRQAFPHVNAYDQRSPCQHPPQPLTPPLPTVFEATRASLPAVPCVAYDPITNMTQELAPPPNAVDLLFSMQGVYDF